MCILWMTLQKGSKRQGTPKSNSFSSPRFDRSQAELDDDFASKMGPLMLPSLKMAEQVGQTNSQLLQTFMKHEL